MNPIESSQVESEPSRVRVKSKKESQAAVAAVTATTPEATAKRKVATDTDDDGKKKKKPPSGDADGAKRGKTMAAVEDTQPPPAADETDYDGVPLPLKVPAVGLQCRTSANATLLRRAAAETRTKLQ